MDSAEFAIQKIANAIRPPGDIEAVNLKVAEKYVDAFAKLAQEGNPLILPGNLADLSGMIAMAMSVVKSQSKAAK